ncbi:NAD(P)/FAD-dependent oxidoreductase [Hoyosella rhizosphaerae]|uniref:NADH:ubiquinone reductase (non-electrogenic) n=1 Tax=Hoyosella rhizosphaerae TaxID=1755582 RepID=A0A916TYI4_9ACTN|nr:NAD(P)/FAD-dependent oxidoreductase [Hoyosella rhizosphaerae]MBN4927277.1 NAD(P)/FAD-dependent oxidoreductase [Hoyosella rhizosphaerae]GGC52518.1 putative NADH dehydrogenase (NDH) [Hoyosella rhizosphaerae]
MGNQPDNGQRHHVVVIGSGFGGLFATQALKRADVDITMIARTTHHLFQPLLYQVATGILSVGEIAAPTRVVLRKQRNTRVLMGEVSDIDVANRTITSEQFGQTTVTSFDSLIVAAGAEQSYFGNDHFAKYAPGMKTVDHALELRGKIVSAFELAELSNDPAEQERLLTFVVVGAGPTGVEMAGQIAELAKDTLEGAFRNIDPGQARIILLDAASQVLPPFGEKLGGKAHRRLEKLGVEIMLNTFVTDVDEYGVVVKDKEGNEQRITAYCKLWAAGVAASPLGKMLSDQTGTEIDRAGRVMVNPDLSIKGEPNIFVVGDMMALDGLPGVAQVAIQGGRYTSKIIKKEVKANAKGEPAPERKPFKYFNKGNMAAVSKYSAVAQVGKINISGFIGWLMWLAVHLVYIVGFKSRVATLFSWIVTFATNSRAQLTVTEQWMTARTAIDHLESLEAQKANDKLNQKQVEAS